MLEQNQSEEVVTEQTKNFSYSGTKCTTNKTGIEEMELKCLFVFEQSSGILRRSHILSICSTLSDIYSTNFYYSYKDE